MEKYETTKAIKEFFDLIFDDDVYIEKDETGSYNIDFKNPIARRDAIIKMGILKRVLNLYLDHHQIKWSQFRINVLK